MALVLAMWRGLTSDEQPNMRKRLIDLAILMLISRVDLQSRRFQGSHKAERRGAAGVGTKDRAAGDLKLASPADRVAALRNASSQRLARGLCFLQTCCHIHSPLVVSAMTYFSS
jgi:hypothetical protein